MRALLPAALLLVAALPARADRLGLAAGTTFPVDVAVRATYELPLRLRVSTSVGVLPSPYVDAIDAIARGFGGYDDATSELIRGSLKSSLVWRTHVGIRPAGGFYVEAGYGLVSLGGGATAAAILSAVTGRSYDGAAGDHTFTARSTLHLIDVEAGFETSLAPSLRLRTALGGIFTFAASTHIEPDFQPRRIARPAVALLARQGELYLDRTYEKYVHAPVVTLALEWDAL